MERVSEKDSCSQKKELILGKLNIKKIPRSNLDFLFE
jgi:hypothetical protein